MFGSLRLDLGVRVGGVDHSGDRDDFGLDIRLIDGVDLLRFARALVGDRLDCRERLVDNRCDRNVHSGRDLLSRL